MKNFILFLLFLDNCILANLTIYNYIQCAINEQTKQENEWERVIYLVILQTLLLVAYLFISNKRKTKRKRKKR